MQTVKSQTTTCIFVENQAADSVISHYAALAKRENIPFRQMQLCQPISIDQIDMCLVLSTFWKMLWKPARKQVFQQENPCRGLPSS